MSSWFQEPKLLQFMGKSMSIPADEPPVLVPVTIASGQSLSSAGNLTPQGSPGALKIVGFALPDPFTKSHITFQVSWNGTDFFEILDYSRRVIIGNVVCNDLDADPQTLGTSAWTLVNQGQPGVLITGGINFLKAQFVKVRSGVPESPVTQDHDAVINIITMPHAATLQY